MSNQASETLDDEPAAVNNFLKAKDLLDEIDRMAAGMNVTDRLHLSRLMYSTAHAIGTRKERVA